MVIRRVRRAERALRRATAEATATIPLRPNRVHPRRVDHNNNGGSTPRRSRVRAGLGLPRSHHRAQGRPLRHRLPHAVPRGRRGRAQALLRGHAGGVRRRGWPASPPSWASGSAEPRTPACARQGGGVSPWWGAAIRPGGGEAGGRSDRARQPHRRRGHGLRRDVAGGRHARRGGLHAHRGLPVGLHAFCLSSRRATARIHADGRVEFRTDPQWSPTTTGARGSSDGPIERLDDVAMDEVRLATPVGDADIARLKLRRRLSRRVRLHRAEGRLPQSRPAGTRPT